MTHSAITNIDKFIYIIPIYIVIVMLKMAKYGNEMNMKYEETRRTEFLQTK